MAKFILNDGKRVRVLPLTAEATAAETAKPDKPAKPKTTRKKEVKP